MSARPLMVLAAAALVLVGIVVLMNRTNTPVGGSNDVFAPALAAALDDIATLRIVGPGDTTIASLSRTDDDWVVDDRDGYRADTGIIRSALTQLSRASTIEAKTSNPDDFDRLGVEDLSAQDAGGIGIEFLPESLGLPGIVLGDASGSSYRFARLTNTNQSWLINADPQVPATTGEWLATEILNVDGSRMERIVIEHADGESLDIFKMSPDQANYTVADIPEGRSLQYPGVANVLGNVLRNLRLEDVAAFAADEQVAEDGQSVAEVTSEFTTFDGLVVTARGYSIDGTGWLTFDASVDEAFSNPSEAVAAEAREIAARTAGWRYRIPDYQYSQISRRLEDLLSAADDED